MNKENKKLFILIGSIVIIVILFAALIYANKSKQNKMKDKIIAEGNKVIQSQIDNDDVDRIAEIGNVESEAEKTDDMREKLGFEPVIVKSLSDGLSLISIKYTDKLGCYINTMLEDTPAQEVKGIMFSYFKAGMSAGTSIRLVCREMTETQAQVHAERFDPENISYLEYNNTEISCLTKKVLLVNPQTYAETVNSENYVPSQQHDYAPDNDNNNELAYFTVCEWYIDGVDYELMGKYIDDHELMINYAKEFIDFIKK